jgi:hypothetical protein
VVTHKYGKPLLKTKDHIYPLSKGGVWHKSNLVYACQYCNGLKQNMELCEFLEYLDKCISRDLKIKPKFRPVLSTIRDNVLKLINSHRDQRGA